MIALQKVMMPPTPRIQETQSIIAYCDAGSSNIERYASSANDATKSDPETRNGLSCDEKWLIRKACDIFTRGQAEKLHLCGQWVC